jgi:secreted PhoX family phosphatase
MKKSSIHRREFLQFMGLGAVALSLSGGGLLSACSSAKRRILSAHPFESLDYSDEDTLRFAQGLNHRILVAWGETLSPGTRFGYNNDFLAFFPLNGNPKDGLLCVNHETPHTLFVSKYTDRSVPKTRAQVEQEMECTGVSIVHIKEGDTGEWSVVKGSKYNRLVNGKSPIPFVSPRRIAGRMQVVGTLANCAGGVTPWGTYLTCEENYDQFYGETRENGSLKPSFFGWEKIFPRPPEHYGWVVEIVPTTGRAKKLTALGRFCHESATVVRAKDGRPVVYSGDDADNQFLYKFVSSAQTSLHEGTLYVANTEKGEWLPLVWKDNPILRRAFKDQTDVLIHCRKAGSLLGATPLDRPEDIEICPRTGAVYVALTNNKTEKRYFGSILKIDDGERTGTKFSSSTFLLGGEDSGVSCPDNMAFDRKGNLWVTTDMSGMNKEPYTKFKNNGLFFLPMTGENAGRAYLVATAPNEAELTGPTFSPDGRTLFLSVQHPGELSQSFEALTSHWPGGGNSIPKPAVVAISGPLLDTIIG